MYKNLQECILDLEKAGHLIRIKEEVDPNLEMAALHLRVYAENGPAYRDLTRRVGLNLSAW